jgi:hypothetical protein
MTQAEVDGQLQDAARVSELRERLSSISWLLRLWTNRMARRANREVHKRGHFWEGRFGCRRLLDEAAVLTCMSYVDLNPVRAGIHETPETSRFTSVYLRTAAIRQRARGDRSGPSATWCTSDIWLSPIHLPETGELGPQPRRCGEPRASDQGVLPIPLEAYLQILDWTARELRADKPGRTPDHLAPILERIGIASDAWLETLAQWHERAGRWVGSPDHMADQAEKLNQKWVRGIGFARRAFRSRDKRRGP